MKNLINNVKKEGIWSNLGLVVIAATCLSIVILTAWFGNGEVRVDFGCHSSI
jgi:hypothetical protein